MYVSQAVTAEVGPGHRQAHFFRYLMLFSPLALVRGIVELRRRQREYRQLLELPAYLLKDVGLTREEVVAGMRRDHL